MALGLLLWMAAFVAVGFVVRQASGVRRQASEEERRAYFLFFYFLASDA
jgi:hypothetical protein